jgi:hypothetical protein
MAHGMRLDHPIFHEPNEAKITLTEIDTPEQYPHYSAGPIGKRMPALKMHEKGKAAPAPAPADASAGKPERSLENIGLVSDGFGFEDMPDSEWISSGVNSKGPESMALGRQASFFLWGFAADPTLMTEAARDVFVNSVCWIKQFDGQRPLVDKKASPREWIFVELWVASGRKDNAPVVPGEVKDAVIDAKSAGRYFGQETLDKHGADYSTLKAWYLDHFEQITSEGRAKPHLVDEDLIELKASNRKPELFERVLARWKAKPDDGLCKRVLARYVPDETFGGPNDLEAWFAKNRARLRFTDFGGYRWLLVPEGAKAPAAAK